MCVVRLITYCLVLRTGPGIGIASATFNTPRRGWKGGGGKGALSVDLSHYAASRLDIRRPLPQSLLLVAQVNGPYHCPREQSID